MRVELTRRARGQSAKLLLRSSTLPMRSLDKGA